MQKKAEGGGLERAASGAPPSEAGQSRKGDGEDDVSAAVAAKQRQLHRAETIRCAAQTSGMRSHDVDPCSEVVTAWDTSVPCQEYKATHDYTEARKVMGESALFSHAGCCVRAGGQRRRMPSEASPWAWTGGIIGIGALRMRRTARVTPLRDDWSSNPTLMAPSGKPSIQARLAFEQVLDLSLT